MKSVGYKRAENQDISILWTVGFTATTILT